MKVAYKSSLTNYELLSLLLRTLCGNLKIERRSLGYFRIPRHTINGETNHRFLRLGKTIQNKCRRTRDCMAAYFKYKYYILRRSAAHRWRTLSPIYDQPRRSTFSCLRDRVILVSIASLPFFIANEAVPEKNRHRLCHRHRYCRSSSRLMMSGHMADATLRSHALSEIREDFREEHVSPVFERTRRNSVILLK